MTVKFRMGSKKSLECVRRLENSLNVVFPKSYVEIVLENNGAYVSPHSFVAGNRIESINNMFSIEDEYEFVDERLPESVVPFGRDAGDNLLCFDFRARKDPGIVFWDHEIEEIEEAITFVSDSFAEFLDSIFENDE